LNGEAGQKSALASTSCCGAGDLAQLVDHPIGRQLGALGPLRLGLLDRFGDLKFLKFWWPISAAVLAL
jgi:hypothetical protein